MEPMQWLTLIIFGLTILAVITNVIDSALAFLVLIGVLLIAEGFDHAVPKGYVYFAMAFSVCVEMLNIRLRRRAARPAHLHEPYVRDETRGG